MNIDAQPTIQKHETVGERHGLALPIELEEGAPPYLASTALSIISGLILILLVWANIAQIRELSIAMGEIAPYGSTRQIAHLEGGIVKDVFVAPGDFVDAYEPLAEIRSESEGGNYDRYIVRRANLVLRVERLDAQTENREPDFSSYQEHHSTLAKEQIAIFEASTTQHQAAINALNAQEASATSEVEKAQAAHKAQIELLQYAEERLTMQDKLIEKGFTSRQSYLEAKVSATTARASVAEAKTHLEQARRALTGATSVLASRDAEYLNLIAEERAGAVAELVELKEPMMSLKDRAERLIIRAPVAGVVKDITVNGAGDVIPPGGLVAEITPIGEVLFAEIRIQPKDIGHITVGQKTEISVTTFDPNRYGKLDGHISHISAGSFADQRTGDTYYTAYVALDRQDVGKGKLIRQLAPGMEVRAEIITQSRTLMQYMLKPVARSLDHAFTER